MSRHMVTAQGVTAPKRPKRPWPCYAGSQHKAMTLPSKVFRCVAPSLISLPLPLPLPQFVLPPMLYLCQAMWHVLATHFWQLGPCYHFPPHMGLECLVKNISSIFIVLFESLHPQIHNCIALSHYMQHSFEIFIISFILTFSRGLPFHLLLSFLLPILTKCILLKTLLDCLCVILAFWRHYYTFFSIFP